jgi:histidinol-phosphate aminotransferase
LLIKTESGQALEIHEALKSRNILVKKLDGSHPLLADCLRINVSTSEENALLMSNLSEILK